MGKYISSHSNLSQVVISFSVVKPQNQVHFQVVKMRQKILILFVHGFLGSESSFESFPLDLLHSLRSHYGIQDLEVRITPRFESKGNIDRAINSLYNWLIMNATWPEYQGVIIIAHSMGGLIAADACRKLFKAGISSSISEDLSLNTKEAGERDQSPADINASVYVSQHLNGHVNILAVFSYDSPFFGLNPNVFSVAVGTKAVEMVDIIAPPESTTRKIFSQVGETVQSVPSAIIDTSTYAFSAFSSVIMATPGAIASAPSAIYQSLSAATTLIPNIGYGTGMSLVQSDSEVISLDMERDMSIMKLPIEQVVIQEITPLELDGEIDELQEPERKIATFNDHVEYVDSRLAPEVIPNDDGYKSLLNFGLTTAAVATAVYSSGGLLAVGTIVAARRLAVGFAISHAHEAGRHIRFLYPLWGESVAGQNSRLEEICEQIEKGRFVFKCYYVHVRRD